MIEIKTIIVPIRVASDVAEFDEKVNEALAEGFGLYKRELIQKTEHFRAVLYAELKRHSD